MVVNTLKVAVLVVGAALVGAAGATVAGRGSGWDGSSRAAAAEPGDPPRADPAALVRRLGDPDFAVREDAEKKLRALGAKALPELRAGAGSDDPEIARRCQLLLAPALRDAREKLVRQLGDAELARREDAEKQLREFGAKALPELRAGLTSDDPEVARRCQALLVPALREAREKFVAEYLADTKWAAQFDHPVWRRYVALAGDTRASRELFAKIVADPRRIQLLDTAEAFPDRRAQLYRDEAARQSCDAFYVVSSETIGGLEDRRNHQKETSELKPEPVTQASLAAYFVLGSYPETAVRVEGKDRAGRPVQEALGVQTWAFDKSAGDVRPALHRLFSAWLDRRVDGETLKSAYWWATSRKISQAVPAARRLLTANKAPSAAQAQAAVYLSLCGDRTDLARVKHLLDDTTVALEVLYGKPAPVQVRDAALAASLTLAGANLADFGFDVICQRRDPKGDAFGLCWLGFFGDESRAAAHKKGRAWLDDEARKKEPAADPGVRPPGRR